MDSCNVMVFQFSSSPPMSQLITNADPVIVAYLVIGVLASIVTFVALKLHEPDRHSHRVRR